MVPPVSGVAIVIMRPHGRHLSVVNCYSGMRPHGPTCQWCCYSGMRPHGLTCQW